MIAGSYYLRLDEQEHHFCHQPSILYSERARVRFLHEECIFFCSECVLGWFSLKQNLAGGPPTLAHLVACRREFTTTQTELPAREPATCSISSCSLHILPAVFQASPNKAVILSEAPCRSIANRSFLARSRRTPAMLVGRCSWELSGRRELWSRIVVRRDWNS